MDTKCDGCDGLKQKSGEKKFIKTLFKGVTGVQVLNNKKYI